jgi:tripartite-type tricarboxylate transporter receptor subunit TctC
MRRVCALFVSAVFLMLGGQAVAQDKFPNRPIKIIVPYGPGGGTDIVARLVAEEMRKALGQPFVVENKPGANGLLALEELVQAKPDGYTLVLANQTVNVIAPLLYPKRTRMDVEKALAPVVRLAQVPNAFVANKDFPVKTFQEFVDYARKNPGKVRYGSTGIGSFPHLDMEMMARRLKLDIIHIPNSKGAAAAMQDLATGDVNVGFLNVATAASQVRSGNVRVLALADDKRSPDYPDAPTLAESGLDGVGTIQWFALLTHAGIPKDAADTLHAAAVAAVKSPVVADAFAKQRIVANPSKSPDDARAWVATEFDYWRKFFKEIPLNLE